MWTSQPNWEKKKKKTVATKERETDSRAIATPRNSAHAGVETAPLLALPRTYRIHWAVCAGQTWRKWLRVLFWKIEIYNDFGLWSWPVFRLMCQQRGCMWDILAFIYGTASNGTQRSGMRGSSSAVVSPGLFPSDMAWGPICVVIVLGWIAGDGWWTLSQYTLRLLSLETQKRRKIKRKWECFLVSELQGKSKNFMFTQWARLGLRPVHIHCMSRFWMEL